MRLIATGGGLDPSPLVVLTGRKGVLHLGGGTFRIFKRFFSKPFGFVLLLLIIVGIEGFFGVAVTIS